MTTKQKNLRKEGVYKAALEQHCQQVWDMDSTVNKGINSPVTSE